jgi:hypothetical protein
LRGSLGSARSSAIRGKPIGFARSMARWPLPWDACRRGSGCLRSSPLALAYGR